MHKVVSQYVNIFNKMLSAKKETRYSVLQAVQQ